MWGSLFFLFLYFSIGNMMIKHETWADLFLVRCVSGICSMTQFDFGWFYGPYFAETEMMQPCKMHSTSVQVLSKQLYRAACLVESGCTNIQETLVFLPADVENADVPYKGFSHCLEVHPVSGLNFILLNYAAWHGPRSYLFTVPVCLYISSSFCVGNVAKLGAAMVGWSIIES